MPRSSNSKNAITAPLPPQHIKPIDKAPGLFHTIKEGFAMGIGASVARNLVDSAMSMNRPASNTEKGNLCAKQEQEYDLCKHLYTTDISVSCDNEIKSLIQCYKS